MPRIRVETFVAAPPERVFDLARDLDLHKRSLAHTGEEAVGGRTSGLIEAGEEVEWRARHLGVTWRLRSRITEMARPRTFTDEQVFGPFASFRHRHEFVAKDGGTLIVDDWTYVAPLGLLGRLADVLFLERHMRRLLEARNAAIREEAERPGIG
jgi:ligand-binding SRPBCC domain-containing protein